MRVLLINGSSRKEGATATALSVIEQQLSTNGINSEWFQIGNTPVRGCVSGGGCIGTNRCVFKDDACNELIEKILKADAVIVGSPVYFAGANGALCSLLDRVFYATCTRSQLFRGKPGAAITTCAWTGGTSAIDRIHRYFVSTQMPIITGCDYTVFFEKAIRNKEENAIQILHSLADNMAEELKKSNENSKKR